MDTMKLSTVLGFAALSLILTPAVTFAETSVRVTNSSNITSNTTSDTKSETHVTITTNGETKTFDTSGDESVDWTSEDGKSKVVINNKSVTGGAPTHTPTPTSAHTPTPSSTPAATMDDKSLSLVEFIDKYFSWLTDLFD